MNPKRSKRGRPVADVRYEIVINGRAVCTSGVKGLGGVLTATLSWVRRKRRPDDKVPRKMSVVESHWFRVGGIDPATDDHLEWCEEPLNPGDEITIRILGPGAVDKPQERYKFSGA